MFRELWDELGYVFGKGFRKFVVIYFAVCVLGAAALGYTVLHFLRKWW